MSDHFDFVFAPPPPPKRKFLPGLRRGVYGLVAIVIIAPIVVVALALLVIAGGVVIQSIIEPSAYRPDVPAPLRNVQSLVVNPADGKLYAGTDRGVFRIETRDEALRLASNYRNAHGLTVIGPDEFLAGGTADFRDIMAEAEPEVAGLVRSTDAGQTWSNVSLSGEARFTNLQLVDDTLYGYDLVSGTFQVSGAEGRRWQQLAQLPPLIDFAANPAEPSTIIAAVDDGPAMKSSDAGSTWQSLEGTSLAQVEWVSPGSLWAADPEGAVLLSSDGGRSWTQQGTAPGPIGALLVHSSGLYAALEDNRIFSSTDDGATWELYHQDANWQAPLTFD